MHNNTPILTAIKQLKRSVFTTREAAAAAGKTLSNSIQTLNHLEKKGIILKISRGVWALDIGNEKISPYSVIPFLLPSQRVYLSFTSALHLHDIIEQIPQTITLASISHSKTIATKLGVFHIHRIAPSFFKGFNWYRDSGKFLIAEPEKALIDCLYVSARKKKQFSYFPELHFSKKFSFKKAKEWVRAINDPKIRLCVNKKLERILESQIKE
ncbi:MAG: type IV toxin-antitoxin system AbiEi family antitoxin domain-containing protein [Candidatus Omnitrophota bacterium]